MRRGRRRDREWWIDLGFILLLGTVFLVGLVGVRCSG